MDTMATDKIATRRHYSAELKTQVMAECGAPGASVAKVAMAHELNANIVHGWRKLAREASAPPVPAPQFVPVPMSPPAVPTEPEMIEAELRRGNVTMRVRWPLSATADFGAWARELLR